MEYKSIILKEDGEWPLALIKCTKEHKEYLNKIKKFNSELADTVERCPKIYSESSEYQSYMIFLGTKCNKYCIGAIYIGTSVDERYLELEIHFDENYICLPDETFEITEQIVDGLAYHFPDKEIIEIKLFNKVDLSRYNKYKYKKTVYDEKSTTYSCKNKYKKSGVKRILEKQKSK